MSRVVQIRRACQKVRNVLWRKFSGGDLKLSTRAVAVITVCVFQLLAEGAFAAEKFMIMTAGLSIRHTPFYYGQENGFFKDEGLEVQALVVRAGQVGIASLMSAEVDAITNAGTGLAAAIRGLPVKIISVDGDRPTHELLVLPTIRTPADLKGKSIGLGSIEGTGGIVMRRILQAKGLDPQRDVNLISMGGEVRLPSMMSGAIAGAMLSPPYTFLAADQSYQVFGRGRDYVRYLTEGIVTSESRIKQKRGTLVRFVRAWNRSAKFYKDNPSIMISYVQKKFAIKDVRLARLLYEDDAQTRAENGSLDNAAKSEVLETAKEIMKVKSSLSGNQVFDFSLIDEAK
jgi:NitT/TauT family transport system substrate-binding protein